MKKRKSTAGDEVAAKKSRVPLILGIIAAVAAVALMLLLIIYFTGPKRAVKRYVKAGIGKNGGKKYFSMILPDYVADQLKSDEKWDGMVESYNDDNADIRDNYKFSIKEINKKTTLSKEALDGAQLYFVEIAKKYDTLPKELDIEKGREFEIKLTKKNRNKKSKTTESLIVCAVKIKGEGWKIAEVSASELEMLSKDINKARRE